MHFVRFELTPAMIGALKAGRALAMGVDHAQYRASVPAIPAAIRDSLVADLDLERTRTG